MGCNAADIVGMPDAVVDRAATVDTAADVVVDTADAVVENRHGVEGEVENGAAPAPALLQSLSCVGLDLAEYPLNL